MDIEEAGRGDANAARQHLHALSGPGRTGAGTGTAVGQVSRAADFWRYHFTPGGYHEIYQIIRVNLSGT